MLTWLKVNLYTETMIGEERPPNGGNVAVQERPTHGEGTSSGTGRSMEEEVRRLLEEYKAAVRNIKNAVLVDKEDVSETGDNLSLRNKLTDLIKEVKKANGSKKLDFLPKVTQEILGKLDIKAGAENLALTVKNSPLVYTLLEGSIGKDLDKDSGALKDVTQKIYNLRDLDHDLAKVILKTLKDKMASSGLKDDPLFKKVSGFLEGRSGLTRPPGMTETKWRQLQQILENSDNPLTEVMLRRHRGQIDVPEDMFMEDYYENAMRREFFGDPRDRELWDALLSVEDREEVADRMTGRTRTVKGFESYIDDLKRQYPGINGIELSKKVSEKVRLDIVRLFNRIYTILDYGHPGKLFEELEREGYSASIEVAKGIFARRLIRLKDNFLSEQYKDVREGFDKFFWAEQTIEHTNVKKDVMKINIDGKDREITKYNYEVSPAPVGEKKQTDIGNFINNIISNLRTTEIIHRYTHNINVLFRRRKKGNEGFWPQIAQYSEEFGTATQDELLVLPDGWLITEAKNLYRKYVEELFGRHNWIHQTQMFTERSGEFVNQIQKRVFEDLKEMYKDEFGSTPEERLREEWRAKRAVAIARGWGLGVDGSEVEIVAHADPNVDPRDGDPTHNSMYTNETDALMPFNPQMHFDRWQHQSHKRAGLLFALTSFDPRQIRWWNHREALEGQYRYKYSYRLGKQANTSRLRFVRDKDGIMKPEFMTQEEYEAQKNKSVFSRLKFWHRGFSAVDPEQKRFYELLPYLSRIGFLVYRGAWRMKSVEHWFVFKPSDEAGVISHKLKLLESWKGLENIGYDIMFHFTEAQILGDPSIATDPNLKADREALWQYVYDKYIKNPDNPDAANKDWKQYINDIINPQVKKQIDGLIKKGELENTPEAIEEWSAYERHKMVMYRGLAGMLLKRVPTKLIKLERDRLSEDKEGRRAWEVVRQSMKNTDGTVWGNNPEAFERFDKAMINISQAEALLRRKVTNKMLKHVEAQEGEIKKSLHDFEKDTDTIYELKEKFIIYELQRMGRGPKEIEDAVAVFKAIKSFVYEDGFIDKFAGKLRKNGVIRVGPNQYIKDFADPQYPFQIANDELANEFIDWKNIGAGGFNRAIREIAEAETQVITPLIEYWDLLGKVATLPKDKRSFEPFIEKLETINKALESIHEKMYAVKVIDELASMTVAYFRKDSMARHPLGYLLRLGQPNSMAAEMNPRANVWEWSASDGRNYDLALRQAELLPRYPRDLWLKPPEITQGKGFLGVVPYKNTVYKAATKYWSTPFLERIGSSNKQVAWEVLNWVLPIVLAYILYQQIKQAAKEQQQG